MDVPNKYKDAFQALTAMGFSQDNILRFLLSEAGWSLTKLSAYINIGVSTVSRSLTGRPSVNIRNAICCILDFDPWRKD